MRINSKVKKAFKGEYGKKYEPKGFTEALEELEPFFLKHGVTMNKVKLYRWLRAYPEQMGAKRMKTMKRWSAWSIDVPKMKEFFQARFDEERAANNK